MQPSLPYQKKSINLNNKKLFYLLKTSRKARRLRLEIRSKGRLIVVKPYKMPTRIAENFIKRKARWIIAKIKSCQQIQDNFFSYNNQSEYLKYKAKINKLIHERIKFFNCIYQLEFKIISVKNQKTLWGSCSNKKNLNFNYKIIFLPKNLRDYIIVHELCHLKEMNHSKKFWQLVAQTIPNYFIIRKILRQRKFLLR